jgi:hypothetical protein
MSSSRAQRAVAWIEDRWVEAALAFIAVALLIATVLLSDEAAKRISIDEPQRESIQRGALYAIPALGALNVILVIVHASRTKRLSVATSQAQALQKALADAEQQMKAMRESAYQDYPQLCRLRLHDLSQELKLGSCDRVSLYVHRPARRRFFLLDRLSPNPVYEEARRQEYDDGEGCIAKAWQDGSHFAIAPDGKAWVTWCGRYGIKAKAARRIRMNSRLYFGWRVRDREKQNRLAVLMLESTDPNRWTQEFLLEYFEMKQERTLNDLLARIRSQIPDPQMAVERGM